MKRKASGMEAKAEKNIISFTDKVRGMGRIGRRRERPQTGASSTVKHFKELNRILTEKDGDERVTAMMRYSAVHNLMTDIITDDDDLVTVCFKAPAEAESGLSIVVAIRNDMFRISLKGGGAAA